MSIFKGIADKIRAERMSHVSEEIQALAARPTRITLAEWKELRMNSWESDHIIPNLDDEALMHLVQYCKDNSTPQRYFPPLVYDEVLIHRLVPELLKRLKLAREGWERATR